jgi:hypothetical protein
MYGIDVDGIDVDGIAATREPNSTIQYANPKPRSSMETVW